MQLGRCPFIKPPAFFHRFIGTLPPPWPESHPLSLLSRSFFALPKGLRQGASPRGGYTTYYWVLELIFWPKKFEDTELEAFLDQDHHRRTSLNSAAKIERCGKKNYEKYIV